LNFGPRLKAIRESRRWSREYVETLIRIRFCKNGEIPPAADTIKDIELERTAEPRNGTRIMILKLFPELSP
jgi:transcriptional regulator with XRE-family HTH domain